MRLSNSLSGKNGFFHIGKIVGVHGLKGTIKVDSYAESSSVFKPDSMIRIRRPTGSEEAYKIKWVKPLAKVVLLSLNGIENCNLAEALIGSELFLKKASLPELEDGVYYWFDIIGLSVLSTGGKYMGIVESIIPTGSNDVFVVKNKDNEILLPALESVVLEIDFKSKTMLVALPEVV